MAVVTNEWPTANSGDDVTAWLQGVIDDAMGQTAIYYDHDDTPADGKGSLEIVLPHGMRRISDTLYFRFPSNLKFRGQGNSTILLWSGASSTKWMFHLGTPYLCQFYDFVVMSETYLHGAFLLTRIPNTTAYGVVPSNVTFERVHVFSDDRGDAMHGTIKKGWTCWGEMGVQGNYNNNENHRWNECYCLGCEDYGLIMSGSQHYDYVLDSFYCQGYYRGKYGIIGRTNSIRTYYGGGGSFLHSDFDFSGNTTTGISIYHWVSESTVGGFVRMQGRITVPHFLKIEWCRWDGYPSEEFPYLLHAGYGLGGLQVIDCPTLEANTYALDAKEAVGWEVDRTPRPLKILVEGVPSRDYSDYAASGSVRIQNNLFTCNAPRDDVRNPDVCVSPEFELMDDQGNVIVNVNQPGSVFEVVPWPGIRRDAEIVDAREGIAWAFFYMTPLNATTNSVDATAGVTEVTFASQCVLTTLATDYTYDFDDGTSPVTVSIVENNAVQPDDVTHTYANPGTYSPKLTTSNSLGSDVYQWHNGVVVT